MTDCGAALTLSSLRTQEATFSECDSNPTGCSANYVHLVHFPSHRRLSIASRWIHRTLRLGSRLRALVYMPSLGVQGLQLAVHNLGSCRRRFVQHHRSTRRFCKLRPSAISALPLLAFVTLAHQGYDLGLDLAFCRRTLLAFEYSGRIRK